MLNNVVCFFVFVYNILVISLMVQLSIHFDHWWIVLFSYLLTMSMSRESDDNEEHLYQKQYDKKESEGFDDVK